MKTFLKYLHLWWTMSLNASQVAFQSRFGAIVFMIGKLLRFGFFLLFLIFLVQKTNMIAGYTPWQIIFFYATYNFIDTVPQFLWREVYRFREQVLRGDFDYTLLRPVSPLFRVLFGGSDVLDLLLLFISVGFIIFSVQHIGSIEPLHVVGYIALVLNALFIALAFHIFVLALGIVTTEVDHALWMYRDITQMGRFPIDIYRQPLKGIVTFAIPIGIMMTFPAKAFLGLLTVQGLIMSFVVSGTMLGLSLLFWRSALRRYSSASS